MRTIRNVIIKENIDDDKKSSAIYEIFNRLNSGGVNLTPQEIRASLFHSDFYTMLYNVNQDENWRNITPTKTPDIHMRDIEILLRAFAILKDKKIYKPSMTKFLNNFSNKAKSFSIEEINILKEIFLKFVECYSKIDKSIFYVGKNRFSVTIFESIFYFACIDAYQNNNTNIKIVDTSKFKKLRENEDYNKSILDNTASSKSINTRLEKAVEILN